MEEVRIGDIKWMGCNNNGYNAKIYYKNKFVVLCIQTHPKAEKRFIWDNEGKKYRDDLNELMRRNNRTLSEIVDIFLNSVDKPKLNHVIPEPTPIRVSTMTFICKLKFKDDVEEEVYIDLKTLVNHFSDNEGIITIKTVDTTKNNKKSFYNQVTLLVNHKTFNVNVKVFKNGQLQMTGCKSEQNAIDTAYLVAKLLLKTNSDIVIDVELSNSHNMYTCEYNKVYTISNLDSSDDIWEGEPIGYYEVEQRNSKLRGQTRLYILDKDTEKYNVVFSKKDSYHLIWETFVPELYRKIYNTNGEHVGEQRIVFDEEFKEYQELKYVHKNNAIFSKDSNDRRVKFILKDDLTVETRGKQKIGVIQDIYYNNNDNNNVKEREKKLEIKTWYETVRYSEDREFVVINEKVAMINTDYVCGFEINRRNLNRILVHEYNLESILKIEKYPGINTKFYTNDSNQNNNGKFVCDCEDMDCECERVSVLTFKSGKIIITGAKKMSHVEAVYQKFNEILRTHFEKIFIRR